MENIIELNNVSMRFNLAREKTDNLKEYVVKAMKNQLSFNEFYALKDVSFQIQPGESVALIGANGSGKSTALKLIAGVLYPTVGTVKRTAGVAPLIELGAGFDMELTARENIFLNGAVMGHDRATMQNYYREIMDFAELWDFEDVPVKNFSSGMVARLGFSIATAVQEKILVVDEVLAVGDFMFQQKCYKRMEEMLEKGTTLLFVSHDEEQVRKLCKRAIWLDHGVVRMDGECDAVCSAYREALSGNTENNENVEYMEQKENDIQEEKGMEKVLSISVAAYNVASTLRETLDPFLQCGVLGDLDIMIVDDGATDNTVEIAQEYATKYPDSIRVIQKKNGGWGSTVNKGIELARGKYFRQVDGDDHYAPENMPAFIAALRETDADMVITPYLTYDDATGEVHSHENCNPGYEVGKTYPLSEIENFAPFMHSLTVKTSCIRDTVKVTEHCFYTDTEFVLKSCNQVHTVMFLDMEIYCYRRASVGQSMSLTGMEKHYAEQTKVIDVLLAYKEKEVTRPEVKRIYDKLLLGTCCWQYLVLLYIKPTLQHKKDLMAYDAMIRSRAPEYYDCMGIGTIDKLRKTHFWGYAFAAWHKKKKDNRFTKDGRMIS